MDDKQRKLGRRLDRMDAQAGAHATVSESLFNEINSTLSEATDTMTAAGDKGCYIVNMSRSNIGNVNENTFFRELLPEENYRVLMTGEMRYAAQPDPFNDLTTKEDILADIIMNAKRLNALPDAMKSDSPYTMTPNPDGTVTVTAPAP